MRLNDIAEIQSGYFSRSKIEPDEAGSHFLLQARDADAHRLICRTDAMVRFNPRVSNKDCILQPGDILFMARGAKNFSVLLGKLPDSVLAAPCFFIIRISSRNVLPGYLWWYLNQAPVERYLIRHSGRGVHMPVVTRSTLEKIEIPLPSVAIQDKIIEMDTLMREEQGVLTSFAEKRKELIAAVCLKAARSF